jgi:hypothetical protein
VHYTRCPLMSGFVRFSWPLLAGNGRFWPLSKGTSQASDNRPFLRLFDPATFEVFPT